MRLNVGADPVTLVAQTAAVAPQLAPWLPTTPLLASAWLSELHGAQVVAKLENLQPTGSFKVRGAFARLLNLTPTERAAGVVTASSGNHGAAVAYAARALGLAATVVVPLGVAPAKLASIRRYGATVQLVGDDSHDAEVAARALAGASGRVYVSPYNDPWVVAGQGTLACEVLAQSAPLDVVIIAVGGGGLIAGVAATLRARWPDVTIIGAQPAASAVMYHSLAAGRIVADAAAPTLSDGTAGGVDEDSITFPWCQRLVDAIVCVDEDEIAAALRHGIADLRVVAEGAAGVALAVAARPGCIPRGGRAAVVICGGNIDPPRLAAILAG